MKLNLIAYYFCLFVLFSTRDAGQASDSLDGYGGSDRDSFFRLVCGALDYYNFVLKAYRLITLNLQNSSINQ